MIRPVADRSSSTHWRGRHRSGFVLLMVIVLLALAVLTLERISRHSISAALTTNEQVQSLQHRWAVTTIENSVLSRAPAIADARYEISEEEDFAFAIHATTPGLPIAETVQFGTFSIDVFLADENTKINLNQLYTVADLRELTQFLYRVVEPTRAIQLQPMDRRSIPFGAKPFDSWGQVFSYDNLSKNDDAGAWLRDHTSQITCWSDGRLNIRRTPHATLDLAVSRLTDPFTAQKLIEHLNENPNIPVKQLIDALELRATKKARLKRLLSDGSETYSLWLNVQNGRKSAWNLSIADFASSSSGSVVRFVW